MNAKTKSKRPTAEEARRAYWEHTKKRLMRDFHVEAAFVGVPKLGRILGLAPSTIYGHVRAGVFFIPHRMMNTTTVFLFDDVVDWICEEQPTGHALAAVPEPAGAVGGSGDHTERVVNNALRSMGLPPRERQRQRQD